MLTFVVLLIYNINVNMKRKNYGVKNIVNNSKKQSKENINIYEHSIDEEFDKLTKKENVLH